MTYLQRLQGPDLKRIREDMDALIAFGKQEAWPKEEMQFLQEFFIVGRVIRVPPGVARRVNPGSAPKRVHRYAGVIREDESRNQSAVMESLFPRVFFKTRSIFGAARKGLNAGHRFNGKTKSARRLAKFAQLSGIE